MSIMDGRLIQPALNVKSRVLMSESDGIGRGFRRSLVIGLFGFGNTLRWEGGCLIRTGSPCLPLHASEAYSEDGNNYRTRMKPYNGNKDTGEAGAGSPLALGLPYSDSLLMSLPINIKGYKKKKKRKRKNHLPTKGGGYARIADNLDNRNVRSIRYTAVVRTKVRREVVRWGNGFC